MAFPEQGMGQGEGMRDSEGSMRTWVLVLVMNWLCNLGKSPLSLHYQLPLLYYKKLSSDLEAKALPEPRH